MRFLTANLDALLVELDDLPQTLALLASLRAEPVAGIEEIVPAARTLLLRFAPAQLSRAQLIERLGQRSLTATVERADTLIEIPVDYQGEDLDEVARLIGLSRDEVIAAHTGGDYTVAFTGFAPGFAYLSGGDARLNVPRRSSPRIRIPAGAVGLAGPFSGVYPQASPGGWQIIGVTATSMWDLRCDVPALLQPGFRVRFVDVSGQALPPRKLEAPAAAPGHSGSALVIRRSGLQALIQDLGRSGHAGQGVSASGAMDRGALRAANRLVGNASDAACVELVDGGFELQSQGDTVLAFTGADAPLTLSTTDGRRSALPSHQAIALSDGDCVTLGEPRAGLRSYLAVRGGFAITPVLGSRSTDTLSGVGPPALKAGDVLPVQAITRGAVVGAAEEPRGDLPTTQQVVVLDVVPGPRSDWFSSDALALLARQVWTVTPQSNRVGLRLNGALPLARTQPGELPSEGVVLGALQVPPSGQPVLFLADHPLTGGYPVIAAVAPYDLDRAGQIPIGARLRFNMLSDPTP